MRYVKLSIIMENIRKTYFEEIIMNIKSIVYISAIVRCGTISKAAEELYISQPALSQYVKKLEEALGAQLFRRESNTLKLTRAGEVFVHEGSNIQQLYSQMCRHISDIVSDGDETVHIGISQFYSKYFLPQVIPGFINEHPNIRLQITEELSSTLESLVVKGELDFCAVPMNTANENLEYEVIHMEEIYLAVPKSYAVNALARYEEGVPYMDLALLKDEPFVVLQSVQKFSHMISNLCAAAGFVPHVLCELVNWDTVNSLIGAGLGVGFVPEVVIGTLPADRAPNYYRISSPAQTLRPYAVAYSKNKGLSGGSRIFVDYFKRAFETDK